MTTREFAESLLGLADTDETERRLILFIEEMLSGYGVRPDEGERGAARQVASRGGYFWLPCPLCSRWYGGQERPRHAVQMTPGRGAGVCPNCGPVAERLNARWPQGLERPDAPAGEPK